MQKRFKADRISDKWKVQIISAKEYSLVDEKPQIRMGTYYGKVGRNEYKEAQAFKLKLLKKYEGKTLEGALGGEEIQTPEGPCYCFIGQENLEFSIPSHNDVREKCLYNLRLLHGIGPKTEKKLKKEGWKSISDLANHPRFGSEAKLFLNLIENQDSKQILTQIGRFLSKTHPLALDLAGFYEVEDFLFFDIETMGLFGRPIILLGVAQIVEETIITKQYILRDIPEEPAALLATVSNVKDKTAFITYNGLAFDVPYLRDRLNYYGLEHELGHHHIDLLHFSRRAWRHSLPNFRLSTLETYLLGLEREIDLPSALVPEFYQEYLDTLNPGPLQPIIEHNKQDLISLAIIFSKLQEWSQK